MKSAVTVLVVSALCLCAWAADNALVGARPTANHQSTIGNLKPVDAITIPQVLSYQGKLTDTLGAPVPTGNYQLTFRLYTVPSGGSPFWTEGQTIPVRNGLFATLLGAVAPIPSVPDAGDLYLSLQVALDPELSPRVRVASAAYAYLTARAANSDLLQGKDTTEFDSRYVNEGQESSVTSNMMVDGTIAAADLGQMGASSGQVMKWTGSAWAPRNDSVGSGGTGTVTSVSEGTGVVCTPNPITATGTVGFDQTYGDGRYERVTNKNAASGYCGLDASTKVPNSRLYAGSGNGLDADMLDGKQASEFVSGSGSAGYLTKWTGSNTVDTSIVYEWMEGRIGIGTTNPEGRFQIGQIPSNGSWDTEYWQKALNGATIAGKVAQNEGRSTVLVLQRPGIDYVTWAGLARFDMSQWELVGQNVSRTQLDIRLGHGDLNNEITRTIMSLRSNGNVGIGTTSPEATLHVVGDFMATGTKSAVVKTSKGDVALYCQESPENWFEDFGEGKLTEGHARIELDRLFLETVTIDDQHPMKVFIQLQGDCNGVYVTKDRTYFEVRELNGGRSDAAFDWRVVAKRRGYEDKRLDVVKTADHKEPNAPHFPALGSEFPSPSNPPKQLQPPSQPQKLQKQ